MATRGRTAGFRMSEEHRVKIQNSNILSALIGHALGEREMSPTQVQAATTLLKKVLPDLSAVTLSGDEDNPITTKETGQGATKIAAALEAIAERSRASSDPSAE